MTDVDFCWPEVVLGANIEAVRFARNNNFFLVKNTDAHYHSYEGVQEEWAQKIYELYNIGKSPIVDKVRSLRVFAEDDLLKAYTDYSIVTIKYEKLHLFDIENVSGLEQNYTTTLLGYRVLDFFDAKGLGYPEIEEINIEDQFIKKISFFKTCRLDGDQPYKDLVCESFLTEEQLKSTEFTDTMARFKTTSILEERGLGKPELKLWKRDVYPIKETIYKEQNSIYWRG